MKKVLKIIGIVLLGIAFTSVLITYLIVKEPSLIIAILIFGITLLLLCLSLKKKPKTNDWIKIETPEEQKKDLKKLVSKNQIQDSIRIMNDCKNLMTTTKNLDTFFERWKLGKQNNLFLKQCEDCKAYKGKPTSEDFSKFFFNDEALLKMIISKTYLDAMEKANKLKTDSGKNKRIQNYFEGLDAYSYMFSPDIEEYIEHLKKG